MFLGIYIYIPLGAFGGQAQISLLFPGNPFPKTRIHHSRALLRLYWESALLVHLWSQHSSTAQQPWPAAEFQFPDPLIGSITMKDGWLDEHDQNSGGLSSLYWLYIYIFFEWMLNIKAVGQPEAGSTLVYGAARDTGRRCCPDDAPPRKMPMHRPHTARLTIWLVSACALWNPHWKSWYLQRDAYLSKRI